MELPSDMWNIILNNLTFDKKGSDKKLEAQYITLAFISQVSKRINQLCKVHKQQLGIQSMEVKSTEFQIYFAQHGFLNCMIYAHKNGSKWDWMTCSNAASIGHHSECLKYAHENGCPCKHINTN